MGRLLIAVLLTVLLGLSGCGGAEETDGEAASAPASPSSATPSPSGAATESPDPDETATTMAASPTDVPSAEGESPTDAPASSGYSQRCAALGSAATRLDALAPQDATVKDSESGSTLPVTTVGDGPVTVVLLHQIRGGACGWASFLSRAGGDERFRFVAPDLCGLGESDCVGELSLDQVAQAQLVLDWVRRTHRPRAVAVVGASMGGAIAVRAAGLGLDLDGVVNISGPDGWFDGDPIATDIRRATVPMLHVYDPADDPGTARTTRAEADRSDGRVRYDGSARGHGWGTLTDDQDRLTPAARGVLDFLAGLG